MSEPSDVDRQPSAAPQSPAEEPSAEEPSGPREVTLRRAPRYRAFVLTGVLVAIAIAALLTAVLPDNGEFSTRALFGYVAVVLALVFGVIGALIAVLVERPRRR